MAGSVLVAAMVFLVSVDFELTPALLALFCVAYLATAVRRWQHWHVGFEITPERVRSGVGDLLEPTELAAEDITHIGIGPGGCRITVHAERKSMTINWKLVDLEGGERLTAR